MRTKRLLIVSALFILALLLSFPLSATPAHTTASNENPPDAWQSLPGPVGGSVSHIAITPDHQWNSPMFAAIQGRGIYRSINDGYNWTPTNSGDWTTLDLKLSPNFAQDNTLFALTGSWQSGYTLRRSLDGGHTWISSVIFPGGLALALSPDFANDQTLYLLTGSQLIYLSTDGGDTFTLVNGWMGDHTIIALAFSPGYATDQTLYALVLNDGLYRSADGGANWQPTGLSGNFSALALSPDFANDELILAIGSDGLVHRSADGGVSWTEIGDMTLGNNGRFSITFSPTFAADQVIMVASSADPGPYRTLDGGQTWEAAGWYDPNSYQDGLIGGGVQALALAPNQYWDGRLFAATRAGIAFSADRGSGWMQMNNGLPILGVRALAHAPNQPQIMLAGSAYFETVRFDSGALIPDSGAIHRSTDGGYSWKQVSGRLARLNALAISPNFANDQTAFAASGMIGQHGFVEGGLYRSTDGGKNWTAVSPAPHAYTALAISPNYANDQTLWAAGSGATTAVGLYRSTNGGTTWALIAPGLTASQLAVSPNYALDQTLFAATSTSGIQRSSNGGQSWTQVLAAPQATALTISPLYGASRTLYAAAHDVATAPTTLYRSDDGGASWQPLIGAIPPEQDGKPLTINALAFAVDGSVLAGGRYGVDGPAAIYRSSDGGATWAALAGLGETAVYQFTSQPANSLDLYAAAASGIHIRHLPQGEPAEPGVWRSNGPRGGQANALAVSPDFASDGIAFAGGFLTDYRGGAAGNGISRSADYGQTWANASNGLAPYDYSRAVLDYDFSPNYSADFTLYAATWGGLFRSANGGVTWTRLETPNTGFPGTISRVVLAPDFPSTGQMLATGGYGGPLYHSDDGGQSWQVVQVWDPEDPPAGLVSFNDMAYSPAFTTDQTIFLASSIGVWQSADGGESWAQRSDAPVATLVISPDYTNDQTLWSGGEAFYHSNDGGTTWISSTVGSGAYIRALAVSPGYPDDPTLFAGTNSGLYWSGDGGASWTAVPPYANQLINRLAISPQWPGHPVLLVGTPTGVFRLLTADLDDGILMEASQGLAILAASPLALSSDGSLLLTGAMNHGVFGSVDGGASWQPRGLQGGMGYYAVPALAISPDYANDQTLFAVSDIVTSIGASLNRSQDGGTTWHFVISDEYINQVTISPDFASDGAVFIAAGGRLRYSSDSGETWQLLAGWDRNTQGAARRIVLPPGYSYSGNGRLFVGSSNGFWHSEDNGASWTQASSGLGNGRYVSALAISPNFAVDGTLLALGAWSDPAPDYTYRQAFFRSTDGGLNWAQVTNGIGADEWLVDLAFSPDYAANQTAYALTSQALYRSRDGGVSWVLVGAPPDGPALSHLVVDSAGRVYVSGSTGVWRYDTIRHNLIVNGGFEGSGGWSLPATATPGRYGQEVAYNGRYAMRLGLDNEANRYGYSSARQTFTLPPGTLQATLTFYLYPASGEATTALAAAPSPQERWLETEALAAGDAQYVLLIDPVINGVLETLHWGLSNDQAWQRYTIQLSPEYAGRPLLLHFGVLNDGVNGRSALYIDDVSLVILDSSLAPHQLHLPLVAAD
jgi:photosystem II stability/assembly factor-like uncharacterized protein